MGLDSECHPWEDQLVDFARQEIRFLSQFFEEEGVRDYVAYRQGRFMEGCEGRDRKKDPLLLERLCHVVEALCRAEFTGSMRAGEADAKLQALLAGQVHFGVLCAPEREPQGIVVTCELDFAVQRGAKVWMEGFWRSLEGFGSASLQ